MKGLGGGDPVLVYQVLLYPYTAEILSIVNHFLDKVINAVIVGLLVLGHEDFHVVGDKLADQIAQDVHQTESSD